MFVQVADHGTKTRQFLVSDWTTVALSGKNDAWINASWCMEVALYMICYWMYLEKYIWALW